MEYKSLRNPISRRTMVKFRATLEKAGSGFRDKIMEMIKIDRNEFEF